MADDTNDTTPGSAPGVLTTGADGSLPDLGGRRAWVWMQDTEEGGGGRFDVRADRVDMWRRKGATVVPNYPLHFGPAGRTAKPARSRFTERPDGGEAFLPRPTGGPTVGDGTPPPTEEETPAEDPTLAMPASALGAVAPADERQPDDRAEPADGDQAETAETATLADQPAGSTDQADGEPAAAKTTTNRKGGRTR